MTNKQQLIHIIFLLISTLFSSTHLQAKSFQVEGSDLLIGVGSEAIGLSGAVTAGVSNIYALYWNPAGLAEMSEDEISISSQTNSKILPINFVGAAFTTNWLKPFGLKSTVALSWIPRLHVKASGAYTENDIESIFLRFALPDLPETFSGDIESKTKDNRITFALMPEKNAQWSLGFSVARVDCETFFCGVTAEEPGEYIIKSTKATAYAFNIGGKYYHNPNLTFGFNFKDINTTLDVELKKEYTDGRVTHTVFQTAFPKDLTFGAQWVYKPNLKLSLDYQTMFGNYGSYKMDFRILRAGMEYTNKSMAYRLGLLAPIKLKADKAADYADKLLFPVAPSLGIGWKNNYLSIDAALYVQLVMSAQKKSIIPGLDISLTSQF